MPRRQNAERYLIAEIEDLILKGRQTIPPWPDGAGWEYAKAEFDDPVSSIGSGGSQNWPILALGCRVLTGFSERHFRAQDVAIQYLQRSKLRYMGSEQDSIIYAFMHGLGALGMFVGGSPEVQGLAMDWLKQMAARCLLFYDEATKSVLIAGERSAGEKPPGEFTWQDTFLHAAMGWGTIPKWEKVLVVCKRILETAGAELRAGVPPQEILLQLGYQTMNPVRVIEWNGGKAVFVPGLAVNGNTQSVKACVVNDRTTSWLPPDRGWIGHGDRRHRQSGRATLTEIDTAQGSSLSYDSPVYGHHVLPIPRPSERTMDLTIGDGSIVTNHLLPPGTPVPPGIPPPPPARPPRQPQMKKFWGLYPELV